MLCRLFRGVQDPCRQLPHAEPDGVERRQENQDQNGADGRATNQRIGHRAPEHGTRQLPEGQARLRQELELQGTFGGVLFELHSWADGLAAQVYTRALELAEQLEDVGATIPVLSGLVTYYAGQCQYRTASDIAVRLLNAAERGDDPSIKWSPIAQWGCACTGSAMPQERWSILTECSHFMIRTDRHLATLLGFDARLQAAFLSCFDLLVLGRLDQAQKRFELARLQLGDTDHKHSRAFAYGYGGMFSLFK